MQGSIPASWGVGKWVQVGLTRRILRNECAQRCAKLPDIGLAILAGALIAACSGLRRILRNRRSPGQAFRRHSGVLDHLVLTLILVADLDLDTCHN